MLQRIAQAMMSRLPATEVDAHCDAPCGVYDPASARVAAEAVLSMTKKLLGLTPPAAGAGQPAWAAYLNSSSRFIIVKEQQAHLAKEELLVLWTDYFKPAHLEAHPNLHDLFWKVTKLCSKCKQEVNLEAAQQLMATVEQIHNVFWSTKGRDVPWVTAS